MSLGSPKIPENREYVFKAVLTLGELDTIFSVLRDCRNDHHEKSLEVLSPELSESERLAHKKHADYLDAILAKMRKASQLEFYPTIRSRRIIYKYEGKTLLFSGVYFTSEDDDSELATLLKKDPAMLGVYIKPGECVIYIPSPHGILSTSMPTPIQLCGLEFTGLAVNDDSGGFLILADTKLAHGQLIIAGKEY